MKAKTNITVKDQDGNNSKPLLPSRLFKFRAYNTKAKKWEFGYDYPNLGGFNLIGEVVLMGELNSVSLDTLFNDLVFTQFTGLKDAKGNEIYEGDILGRTTIPDRYVSFENGSFITNKPHIPNYKPIILIDGFDVVIGNIFENPEMLSLQVEEAGR